MPDRSPESYLPLKHKHLHILATIAEEPLHGYRIRQKIDQRTGGRIVLASGTLYETLQRLQRDDLVSEVDPPDGMAEEAGSRWRFYRATELGRDVLRLELARLDADIAALRAALPTLG